jgi:hypothetical protein
MLPPPASIDGVQKTKTETALIINTHIIDHTCSIRCVTSTETTHRIGLPTSTRMHRIRYQVGCS